MSSTIAPSWPCVLRTPSETLYTGCPTTRVHCLNRVWHTLPLAAVETPLICEFVRERIRGRRTTLPLQRHASVASGFTEIEDVRFSDLLDWSLAGLVNGWCYRRKSRGTRLWSHPDCRQIRPLTATSPFFGIYCLDRRATRRASRSHKLRNFHISNGPSPSRS